jgi:uncharacterized protein (TIGR02145 family)
MFEVCILIRNTFALFTSTIMRVFYILLIIVLLYSGNAFAQVGINTDGSQPAPSAILDIKSSSKGLLLPRMTYNERNSISNPAEGLIVFCTNCGIGGSGILCLYTGGQWLSINLCMIPAPSSAGNQLQQASIVWCWHPVNGATGYKWNSSNSLETAIDLGADTTETETGINCGSVYTSYVWSYSECGTSLPLVLMQSTATCFICGQTVNVSHIAGDVAPVNKTISYGTVSNIPGETSKCWIKSNLGSDHVATAVNDATEASAGWYWQFNRKQGYKHDGTTRTPNSTWTTTIMEYFDWTADNDPCSHELTNGWRIPTRTEWENVKTAGGWGTWQGPWGSALKMHAAGRLNSADGTLANRGMNGIYWSSTQNTEELGWRFNFNSGTCGITSMAKAYGFSVRCVRN